MNPKRILIFNHRHIGDVLMTTPAMWAIREQFPNAWIDCVTNMKGKFVLRQQLLVDRLFDEKEIDTIPGKGWYDIAVLFKATFRNARCAKKLKIKKRVGKRMEGNQLFLTDSVKTENPHWIHQNNEILFPLGISKVSDQMKYLIPPQLVTPEIPKPYIVLNPGASTPTNRWPAPNFARLANYIMERFPHHVVITGAREDSRNAEEIKKRVIHRKRIHNLAGKTRIEELASTLKDASAVVTGDTGPMHLAIAVNQRNVLALFGPANEALTGPLSKYGTVLAKDLNGAWRKSNPKFEQVPVSLITPEEVCEHLGKRLTR
ncbi:glycosyltransferase family 9 protein [Bdellovibrionota bacterium]